ncbi:MAG: glycosyltransferase family 4 protein [Phycisphaeraceae bacterium]
MKAALLADRSWLMGELATLRRLVVGLVDDQVRVVRVVPEDIGVAQDDALAITSTELHYRWSPWRWIRDWALRQLRENLREAEVDVLHVLDGSLCAAGMQLGQQLNIPVICSVWSQQEIDQLPMPPADVTLAIAAPTRALTERCRRRLSGSGAVVEYIPAGVYRSTSEQSPPLADPSQTLSCVVAGDGRLDAMYAGLLEAMAEVRDQLAHAVYFLHSVSSDQHRLWQMAERLKLLDQVSLVPHEPGSRQLLVQADVVIQPQPLGQVRTLVLEAMAAGRPVIATLDPMLDYLIDQRTAKLLQEPTADDWTSVLKALVEQPAAFVELGQTAREYVGQHHSAGRYVEHTLTLYRRLAAKPLPFRR